MYLIIKFIYGNSLKIEGKNVGIYIYILYIVIYISFLQNKNK